MFFVYFVICVVLANAAYAALLFALSATWKWLEMNDRPWRVALRAIIPYGMVTLLLASTMVWMFLRVRSPEILQIFTPMH